MSAATQVKVAIVGAGPAGYTAAVYAARALLEPLVFAGPQPGGQLTVTTEVENYPGFADVIQGPWLVDQMERQAKRCGASILNDEVASVDLGARPFRVVARDGRTFDAETIILATGAQARWLGLPSEARFRGFGVSACATCDGIFFMEKPVAVVGGGNTAVEEALFLSRFVSSVAMIHRGRTLRAEKVLQERLFADPKIAVLWDHVVDEVVGEEAPARSVTGIRVRHLSTGRTRDLVAEGIFVAIGHRPSVELFGEQLRLTPNGYVWVEPGTTRTSVPGVFAAGDVADDRYRQAVTAAGLGCMAALDAERFLSGAPAHSGW